MKSILKYSVLAVLYSSLVGPSLRLPFLPAPINIYISDIFVGILAFILLLNSQKIHSFITRNKISKYFFILSFYFLLTWLLTPIDLRIYEKLFSFLYLLRFVLYFGIFIAVSYLKTYDKDWSLILKSHIYIAAISLCVIGWLQYFFYPDLRNLSYLGWDPHYKRIFALIFDPNYLGLIFVYSLLFILIQKNLNIKNILSALFVLLTLVFTYSRSTYLALAASLFIYLHGKRQIKLYALGLLLFAVILFLLPRPGGVGVELERVFTAKERIKNWQSAANLISKYPIFGIGFNTLRFYDKSNLLENSYISHSSGGVDNSFLFVAVTIGITGLVLFIFFLAKLYENTNILGKSVILASIIHSLFINSLFFSFTLIWFWILVSLDIREIKEKSEV